MDSATGSRSALRVLLVDDDDMVRRTLRRVLEKHGIDVEDVADGANALARVQEREFGCAIVDLQMPGWDGARTAEALRAVRPNLPFIVWSGGAPAHLVERVLALGPLAYVHKSGDPLEIVEALRAIG